MYSELKKRFVKTAENSRSIVTVLLVVFTAVTIGMIFVKNNVVRLAWAFYLLF